jgi:hypothetical protein
VCGECHAPDHTRFRDERVTVTEDQHATTGFPLVGPHALVATDSSPGPRCADCHAPDLPSFQERHPGRTANDCAACHADPHGGQFALGAFADSTLTGGGCVQCHGEAAFAPHRFDDTLHATAAFVRDGAHAALDCNVCHVVPEPGAPRRFVGTPLRCEACHDDAHEGAFAARAEVLDATAAGACAHCHGTTTFDAVEAFAHGAFTGFELAGAHAESDCESCHAPAPERDALGRRFGRVHSHFPHIGEPAAPFDCARCHADPHGGSFAAACATCHVESSFRALPHGFDHGVATGFPLEGAHAAASCSACHDPLPFPTAEGRTAGPAAGTRCSDCHADPHGGQFHRVDTTFPGGGTDCSRCHTPDPGFPPSSFDHGWDTVFPLDGSHADVACAACHRPERMLVDGRELELVRYRPLGRECVDCHGEQAGALRRRGKGRGR